MAYVIQKAGGLYVAKPGHAHSYTNRLDYARKFQTREEAEGNLCPENERVVELERVLDLYRR